MAWQNRVEGSLYWRVTYWTQGDLFPPPDHQDPWQDPMSYNFHGGTMGTWGNGDGRLLYPPRGWQDGVERVEGPTPSIRWELLREGIEDYEYFWLVRDAADRLEAQGGGDALVAQARSLLQVPAEIAASLTEFTDEPGLLAAHRRQLATALEALLQALAAGAPDAGVVDGAPDDTGFTPDSGAGADSAAPADAALADSAAAPDAASGDLGAPLPDAGASDLATTSPDTAVAVDAAVIGGDAVTSHRDAGADEIGAAGCSCAAATDRAAGASLLLSLLVLWRRRSRTAP
jgi:hypothetical protein